MKGPRWRGRAHYITIINSTPPPPPQFTVIIITYDAHDAHASSLIMVSCVRNISREAAAAPPRSWMATSHRHPLFLLIGNPTGQAPSSTQATVGPRHVRRTHKHVTRHRLTGHETIQNAKLTVKRARRTRAHDERRHVPRNSHSPTQARRTNISRVRHATNTRAIVFTTTTTRQSFFTQT